MNTINLTIDGIVVAAREGQTVLEAALAQGIYIPHLCHHPDLKPVGVCRLCMVEIAGRGVTISCKTPVAEGMVVRTETPEIALARKVAVELLVVNHHVDCLACAKDTECGLQDAARFVGITGERLEQLRHMSRVLPLDTSNPFFVRDANKCVLCGICVRTCEEIVGASAIDYAFRGYATVISTMGNKPIAQSRCESCGECVVRCPVGALLPKEAIKPAREVKSVCGYCGVGCNIYLGARGDKVVSVRGVPGSPVNQGRLCVKGRYGYSYVGHRERLRSPLVRRDGTLVEASWDEALDLVAARLAVHRGEQFAALASARCSNEENYVLQKFTRAVMGSHNVDHCARLCHSASVTGLATSFGSGAMTNSIGDIIHQAQGYFVIGSNTTEQHPVLGMGVRAAVKQRGAKLVVADPRIIPLAELATIHLRHRPGSDIALLNALMHVIVTEGLYDRAFVLERTEGFEDLCGRLEQYTPEAMAQVTGVAPDLVRRAARLMADVKPLAMLYAMGITQHSSGHQNVLACANLQMLLGNLGVPGGGVNPLRGQNNVQGACDMGGLPNYYPGYQSVATDAARTKFEAAWGVQLGQVPGLTVVEMTTAALEGRIKAMYILGENPMVSDPDLQHVREALEQLDFLVVQDIFLTETAALADVVLPGAAFAEKTGTFTNTERRVQLVSPAVPTPGEARQDWEIIAEVARRVQGAAPAAPHGGFAYSSAAMVMEEIAALTPIYGGICYERLAQQGLQWPCPSLDHPGTPILHTGKFSRGLGRFVPTDWLPPAEQPDPDYPLVLTTGRVLYHYHTGSQTRRVPGLVALRPEATVELHPTDARKLGVGEDGLVRVSSRRGSVVARAEVTERTQPGLVFMTFHFAEAAANLLTNAALDPVAKIPELKVCAVRVEPVIQELAAAAS
ncbi:MAG: formate dehydrogenase subunit alpha [Anaerolineae bacterium]